MIYVTHDQIEAMTLADRIVLLRDGVDRATGRAARPLRASGHALRRRLPRLAAMNFVPGKLVRGAAGADPARRRRLALPLPRARKLDGAADGGRPPRPAAGAYHARTGKLGEGLVALRPDRAGAADRLAHLCHVPPRRRAVVAELQAHDVASPASGSPST